MNYLLLAVVTAAIVALWPIMGNAMKGGARPTPFGFVLSVSGLICGLLVSLITGKPVLHAASSLLGLAGGIGFAIGFCVLIFRALEIGPTGPTATLNNLALIWPIIISLLFFSQASVSPLVWLGLVCTLATLILMGWQKNEPGRQASQKWFFMSVGGFLLAGVNGTAQFLSAQWAPGNSMAFCNAMFALSLIVLGLINLAKKQFTPHRIELISGIISGILFALVVIPLSIILQERMPTYIVLPVSQAGSLIIVVLIGKFFLKEHLSPAKWAACVTGVAAILCLTL